MEAIFSPVRSGHASRPCCQLIATATQQIRLSQGRLVGLSQAEWVREADTLLVTWNYGPHTVGSFADDVVYLVLYHVSSACVYQVQATRADGMLTAALDAHMKGDGPCLLYLLVCDRQQAYFANSQYLGAVT